jgi:hypothetical protein
MPIVHAMSRRGGNTNNSEVGHLQHVLQYKEMDKRAIPKAEDKSEQLHGMWRMRRKMSLSPPSNRHVKTSRKKTQTHILTIARAELLHRRSGFDSFLLCYSPSDYCEQSLQKSLITVNEKTEKSLLPN